MLLMFSQILLFKLEHYDKGLLLWPSLGKSII